MHIQVFNWLHVIACGCVWVLVLSGRMWLLLVPCGILDLVVVCGCMWLLGVGDCLKFGGGGLG